MGTISLTNLMADVRSHVEEGSARQYSDVELTRWLNEAARDVARRAECLENKFNLPWLSGQSTDALPAAFARARRAEYSWSGGVQPLEMRDYNAMDEVWGTQPSGRGQVPYYLTVYARTITVYPVPSVAGNLYLYGYRLPTDMTAGGHFADLPNGWDDLLVDYAAHRCWIKDGDPRWQEAKGRYEAALTDLMDRTRTFHDQAGVIVGQAGGALPRWLADPYY